MSTQVFTPVCQAMFTTNSIPTNTIGNSGTLTSTSFAQLKPPTINPPMSRYTIPNKTSGAVSVNDPSLVYQGQQVAYQQAVQPQNPMLTGQQQAVQNSMLTTGQQQQTAVQTSGGQQATGQAVSQVQQPVSQQPGQAVSQVQQPVSQQPGQQGGIQVQQPVSQQPGQQGGIQVQQPVSQVQAPGQQAPGQQAIQVQQPVSQVQQPVSQQPGQAVSQVQQPVSQQPGQQAPGQQAIQVQQPALVSAHLAGGQQATQYDSIQLPRGFQTVAPPSAQQFQTACTISQVQPTGVSNGQLINPIHLTGLQQPGLYQAQQKACADDDSQLDPLAVIEAVNPNSIQSVHPKLIFPGVAKSQIKIYTGTQLRKLLPLTGNFHVELAVNKADKSIDFIAPFCSGDIRFYEEYSILFIRSKDNALKFNRKTNVFCNAKRLLTLGPSEIFYTFESGFYTFELAA